MKKLKEFFSLHSRAFATVIVVLLIVGYYVLRAYHTAIEKAPKLVLEENVVDTHEYIPQDEEFLVSDSSKEYLGKHFRLSCETPTDPKKTENGDLYSEVIDIRSKSYGEYGSKVILDASDLPRRYALLSEEPMPKADYVELDCLVCGYYSVKYQQYNNVITEADLPLLRFVRVIRPGDDKLEFSAPLQRVEEPRLSVTEQNITLTIDKIEYRENLNRIFYTLDNQSDLMLGQQGLKVKCEDKELSGLGIGTIYKPAAEIQVYIDSADETLLPLICEPGSKHSGNQIVAPSAPGKPLNISMTLYDASKEKVFSGKNLDKIILKTTYLPPAPTEAETKSE